MSPRIAYLTAGAAGMYCGSCMHDNTLARALTRQGVDIQLIPTYTPIRTDEENISTERVFFGGINVYLEQTVPMFRFIPSFLVRFLDHPALLRWAARRGMQLSPKKLGALTVSMLKGNRGYQRKEVAKLSRWLSQTMKPDLINLSNMLIAGCVPEIKKARDVPVLATLQGDDIFLNELVEPYREQALTELRQLVESIDGFITNSRYYAETMGDLLQIPAEKINIVPLGIDVGDFHALDRQSAPPPDAAGGDEFVIGYLARIAPEKGLHVLIDAFIELRLREDSEHIKLHAAGWLGEHNQAYLDEQIHKLREAGLESSFVYLGTLDRLEKIRFLGTVDLLSVPTTYREPKGLFVLEALAAGIPVVQPNHGAFPELMADLGGGRLVEADNSKSLAAELYNLATDHEQRRLLGQGGRQRVHERRNENAMASEAMKVFQKYLEPGKADG